MPQVTTNPSSSLITYFQRNSSSALTASIASSRVTSAEWRHNEASANGRSGVSFSNSTNGSSANFTLTIDAFSSSLDSGTWSLIVIDWSGTFVAATWLVRQAGEYVCGCVHVCSVCVYVCVCVFAYESIQTKMSSN